MSTEENGNGLYKGMPWWVKAGMIFGAPTVLVFVVLYLYASAMNSVMTDVRASAHAATKSAEAAQEAAEASVKESRGVLTAIREHQDATIKVIKVLEIMCQRMGKNDYEREVCIR